MVRRIDVARRAGVSPSAVSRVINENGYVAADVRERVTKAIQELNYIPNRMAQSLRMKQCRQIACIIPSLSNPFYHDIVMGIEETTLEHGYTFSLYNMTSERKEYLKLVLEGFYDGLIFLSPFEVGTFFNIEEIVPQIPTCLYCDRQIDYVVPHVYVDLRKAMKRNVDWLIEAGHRDILFLGQEFDVKAKIESPRYEGYIQSLTEHGMGISPHLTQLVPNLKDTLTVGYERVKSLIADNFSFSAVAASNDLLAVGTIRALMEHGVKVPSEVSVTGVDDVEIARLMTPTLTTTRIPKREIGNMLVRQLLQQINKERPLEMSYEFPTELVIRESTGAHVASPKS